MADRSNRRTAAPPPGAGGLPVGPGSFADFHEASQAVLAFLRASVGFDLWMVTRTEGEDWIVLEATDNTYGVEPGQVLAWRDSFCSRMVEGAPRVAPRADEVEAYRLAPIGAQLQIGSYVGVPLLDADGALFGTLCAIDPAEQDDDVLERTATVDLLAALLGTILQHELRVSEQERKIEIAEATALTDVLTGLPNRRAWSRFLAREEARCRRFGHPATVLIIDLDGLKQVNDTDGHAAGDELLRRAAVALREGCRDADLAARLGGDEFGVIATESDGAAGRAVRARIERALEVAGIAASVGVAPRPAEGTLAAAAEAADRDMYRRKRSTRT